MGNVIKLKQKIKLTNVLALIAAVAAATALMYINRDNFNLQPASGPAQAMHLDSSVSYTFKKTADGITVCGNDSLIEISDTGQVWSAELDEKNPHISTAGRYVLAAEPGGKRITLFEGGKIVNKIETADEIITARVNRKGRIAVATKEKGYRSQVLVFAPDGKQIYAWHSATYYVLDLALCDGPDMLAVAGLDSDNGEELSSVLLFSLNSSDYITVNAGNDNLVTSIEYIDDGILAVGDIETLFIKKNGEIPWRVPYRGRILQGYTITGGGCTALALTKSSMEGYFGGSDVEVYGKNGKLRGNFDTGGPIKFIDSLGEKIIVDTGSGASIINNRANLLEEINFDKEPRECFLISGGRKIIMIVGNSVEIMDF